MISTLVSALIVAVFVTAICFAYRAASTARTPQGAVGWVVFLLAAPYLAIPTYLFLGQHRFRGYLVARRESEQVVAGIRRHAAENAPDSDQAGINLLPFEKLAGMPATRGNDAALLRDGQATFDAIFAAIDAAETYILVQFYIIHDDATGRALQDRLLAAAARGVRIRLLTDPVGSIGLPDTWLEKLRAAGIDAVDGHVAGQRRPRFQINFRNHRKIVVVDGLTGFVGGLNVGDEYMGLDPQFGRWRDTHLRVTGPIVPQLQLIFAEDWHWATGASLLDDLRWVAPQQDQDRTGLILATGPGDPVESGSLMFFSAIAAAQERFWIASPYFVPDIDVLSALKHAALRGVDTRILLPEKADHWLPWLAAFAYYDELAEVGVGIYRYTDGFMHQKAFLVDDRLAAIGTSNLDNRSFRLNFEVMALLADAPFCAKVEAMLKEDFKGAYRLSRTMQDQPLNVRLGAPVARLFSPLL